MNDERDRNDEVPPRSEAPVRAKRTERHGQDADAQTAEYANDMLTNRFTPPPPPDTGDEKK